MRRAHPPSRRATYPFAKGLTARAISPLYGYMVMERTTPTCAIKVVDIVGHAPNCEKLVGNYVKEIGDIDAPRTWTFTRTVERAQHFELSEALALYNTQSVMYPLRDDGKANRPLTVFTVFLEHV